MLPSTPYEVTRPVESTPSPIANPTPTVWAVLLLTPSPIARLSPSLGVTPTGTSVARQALPPDRSPFRVVTHPASEPSELVGGKLIAFTIWDGERSYVDMLDILTGAQYRLPSDPHR